MTLVLNCWLSPKLNMTAPVQFLWTPAPSAIPSSCTSLDKKKETKRKLNSLVYIKSLERMQILVILVNHTSTRKNMADHKLGSGKQLFLTFPTSFTWFTMRYTNRTLCELYDSHTPLHFENEPLSTPLPAQSLLRVLLCVLLLLFHYVITLRDFLLHSFLVCKIFPLSNSLSNMSKHF